MSSSYMVVRGSIGWWASVLTLLLLGLVSVGCKTGSAPEFADPSGKAVAAGGTADGQTQTNADSPELIHVGDSLTFSFTDLPTKLDAFVERVKDDGTVTLIENQTFTAAGKTRGELEREIRKRYVPDFFTRMTVTILPQERYFFIDGEVKSPGRQSYTGPINLTRAIASAGYFTDFANKKKVQLIRADGKRTHTFNCNKLLQHPEMDPEIFPGDKIHVPRRIL